jgi:histidinol-phosphate aminotransferase
VTLPRPRADLDLEGYHSPQLDVDVRLNTNESPYPPPPEFLDAWLAALRAAPLHRYPDRAATRLRERLGSWLEQPPSRVFCANGSNEVLQTLLLAYGGPGRRALVFEPTYALHSHIARVTGTEVVAAERADDFTVSPTEAGMLVAAERPAVVFLCSPNNPTGTVERRSTVEALLGSVIDHGPGLLVVDEAYGEFAGWSALELVADDVPLVVVRTYSKVWSLAGLRLGFGIGPAALIETLDAAVLPYHLATPTQLAGIEAVGFEAEMRVRVKQLVDERTRVADALEHLWGLTVYPSGANFLLVRVDGDAREVWRRLAEHGVLVRDVSGFHPRLGACLRLTIGAPAENDTLIEAMRHVLRELRG